MNFNLKTKILENIYTVCGRPSKAPTGARFSLFIQFRNDYIEGEIIEFKCNNGYKPSQSNVHLECVMSQMVGWWSQKGKCNKSRYCFHFVVRAVHRVATKTGILEKPETWHFRRKTWNLRNFEEKTWNFKQNHYKPGVLYKNYEVTWSFKQLLHLK